MPELTAPAEITSCSFLHRQPGLHRGRAGLGRRRRDRLRDEVVDELERVAVPRRAGVDDVLAERGEHGLQRANTASSAPTIVLSRPCSASTGVRASGASTNSARFAPKSSRISPSTPARRSTCRRRSSPRAPPRAGRCRRRRSDSICGVPVTHRNTMSDCRATLGVGRHFLRAGREQVLERLPVAVRAHGERIALGDEVLRHAVAHQAQPDEADARLRVLRSCVLRVRDGVDRRDVVRPR